MQIYLDNAATTRVCDEAAKKAFELMTSGYGNSSSSHSLGREAKRELEKARETVSKSIGAEPSEIFFTSGGTEGNNWAIKSAAKAFGRKNKHIISSMAEHDSVRNTLSELESSGFEVTRLKPLPDGGISPEAVEAELREDTFLVSLMLVNNETGAITDLAEIARRIKKRSAKTIIHTDAVQAYLKIPFSVRELGADMITISGHKVHAPKGIGALYVSKAIKLPPLLQGGTQEGGRRAGTEPTPLIAAFSEAVSLCQRDSEEISRNIRTIRDIAATRLKAEIPGLRILCDGSPYILSISMPGYKSESLINFLDAAGIFVSKSSACKKGARSHVLKAAGLPANVIDGALRISFSRYNSESDAHVIADALREASLYLLSAGQKKSR